MKALKSAKFWLCIALVLCLLSMVGTACMQGNFGSTKVKTYYVTTAELAEMIRANNAETGKDIQIHFGEDAVNQFSFMTLIPKNATADNPVPAIICAHGGANTKEMQMPGYIELARRGFVVVTIDMAEHGYSDAGIDPLTGGSYGMLAAAEYAMSLPCVRDSDRSHRPLHGQPGLLLHHRRSEHRGLHPADRRMGPGRRLHVRAPDDSRDRQGIGLDHVRR